MSIFSTPASVRSPRPVLLLMVLALSLLRVTPTAAQLQGPKQDQSLGGEVGDRSQQLLHVGLLTTSGSPTVLPDNDFDNDGLTNAFENAGWQIVIDYAGYGPIGLGTVVTIKTVTSDPHKRDTDADGLDDKVEFLIGTDPRSADTDGDGLTDEREWNKWYTNPSTVDSDGDSRGPDHDLTPDAFLFDGQELATDTHVTSPTLDDTDGDGRTDQEELYHPFFHPLIAELPRADIIIAGDLDLRLDVEYAESVGVETAYEVSLSSSETNTSGTSSSLGESESFSTSETAGVHSEVTLMAKWETTVKGEANFFPPGASTGATQALGGSVSGTLGGSYDYTQASESIQESVFTSSSETSAESGQMHSQLEADSTEMTEVTSSGRISLPIQIFNEGLITYQVNNLGITLLKYERPPFGGTGTFKAMGTIVPDIPTATLAPGELSTIFNLEADNLSPDVVRDFMAAPSTLVLQPTSFDMLDANGIDFDFITENAFTQTVLVEIDFGGGVFETFRVATNVDRDGGTYNGIALGDVIETVLGLDHDVEPATLDGQAVMGEDSGGNMVPIQILTGLEGLQTEKVLGTSQVWLTIVNGDLSHGISAEIDGGLGPVTVYDFNSIRLFGGDTVKLIYTQDLDGDGLWAAEEVIYGTVDSADMAGGLDPASADFDLDMLNDMEEAKEGWDFTDPEAGVTYRVYSDPRTADTDFDGLDDLAEKLAGTNPRDPDSDGDGTPDGVDGAPLAKAIRLYAYSQTGGSPSGVWDMTLDEAFQAANLANGTPDPADDVVEIWVAEGGSFISSFIVFPRGDVKVYGGFQLGDTKFGQRDPDPLTNGCSITIFSGGSLNFPFNQYAFPYAAPNGTLDGFTITSGTSSPVSTSSIAIREGIVTLRNLLVYGIDTGLFPNGPAVDCSTTGGLVVENCNFSQCRNDGIWGGAVSVRGSVSSVFRNSEFLYNRTRFLGGAVECGASLIVENNEVGGVPRFEDCLFLGNQSVTDQLTFAHAGGGAIALAQEGGEIFNCDFVANRAWSWIPDNDYAYGYKAFDGGAIFWDRTPVTGLFGAKNPLVIVNSRFYDNTAGYGSAIYVLDSQDSIPYQNSYRDLAITNSTFSRNTGTYIDVNGAAFFGNLAPGIIGGNGSPNPSGGDVRSKVTMTNCVSYGNLSNGFTPATASLQDPWTSLRANIGLGAFTTSVGTFSNDVSNNLFGGDTAFTPGLLFNNLFQDPKFMSQAAGNLRLAPDSPGIDAGVTVLDIDPDKFGIQLLPPTDLDGKPRVVDGPDLAGHIGPRVDLGAYELP